MHRLTLFFRLLTWFSLRQIRAHRGRAVAVFLGIGLGAAVFTSVRLAVNASLDSFTKSMDLIAGRADWVVARPGGRISEDLVASLLKHPAVRTASPVLSLYVQPLQGLREPFLLIGFDPILDRPLRDWKTEEADSDASKPWLDLLKTPYTLVVGQNLADRYGLGEESEFALESVHQKAVFRVSGKLSHEGLALVEGGQTALTDIATLQEFTGIYGLVDRIDLLLKPWATATDIEALRSMLPHGVLLEKPSETRENGEGMIRAYQLNLSVLSFVSLFVGMFLVYSLVALNAASRRHELAVLRSVGASSRLIFLLFLGEGAFFGIVGWLTAIPLSTFLIKYLLEAVGRTISTLFVQVRVEDLGLSAWEILLSFGITVSISVLAAYQPAREAMRVAPREALSSHDTLQSRGKSVNRIALFGLLLIALVRPLSHLPPVSGFPLPGYFATFLLFSGFSLLSPWCLQRLGTFIPPLLRRMAGHPAYLAGRYVRDAGTRTAISVGALITAMALFTALSIMVYSFRETVALWVHQSISGDLFIRPQTADINSYRDPLPPECVKVLRTLKTPVDLLPYRRLHLRYGEIPYQFEALELDVFANYGNFLFVEGNPEEVMPRLLAGQGVVVSEVFSNQTGLKVGERYRAEIEGVKLDLPVLGIVRDYRTRGGVVDYSLKHFQEKKALFSSPNREEPEPIWSGSRIYFPDRNQDIDAAASELKQEILRRCAQEYGIEITLGSELRQAILRIFDETFAVTTVLLLIALAVAALGITTTLTVLVLERRIQLNTLLAVGASFGQIRSMIFWEAVLMVMTGEVIGLLCGFFLSYLLIFVINLQSFGWTFVYGVDWASVLGSLPLILITALMASLPAGRMALRQPPAAILRER